MKIVHIITRLILGGAQENTLITCRLLAERGHEVTLITGPAIGPEGALFEQTENAGYNVIVVDKLRREISPAIDIAAYLQIKKLLKQLEPDIVHTHSAKAGILGRRAGRRLKGKFKGRPKNRPVIIHTVHGHAFHPFQSERRNRFYISAEQAAAKWTDAFISVANAMTEKAHEAGIGLNKPWTTAYSAIDEDAYLTAPTPEQTADFRRQYSIPLDATVIIKIARIFELKGHEYVIESAKTLSTANPEAIWLFVGDGLLMNERKQEIQRAGLEDRFRFTGLLQPEQIPLAIHSSDFLVHCSLREGLARVLPQAMLCGKPVVSFDIDGAKEVVNPDTGFLVEPMNVQNLIYYCRKLLDDPALRRRLGENARQFVIDKFAPKTMVDTIEEVYNNILSNAHIKSSR